MKNKIGICFLTVIAILLALFILEKINTGISQDAEDDKAVEIAQDTQSANSRETSMELSSGYIVRNENGMLTIYSGGGGEKFFDSGIYYDELPADIQHKIDSGLGFENEADLYDFLESYSS